jgi:hypothetical protein
MVQVNSAFTDRSSLPRRIFALRVPGPEFRRIVTGTFAAIIQVCGKIETIPKRRRILREKNWSHNPIASTEEVPSTGIRISCLGVS